MKNIIYLVFYFLLLLLFSCNTSTHQQQESINKDEHVNKKLTNENTDIESVKSENPTFQLSVFVPSAEDLPEGAVSLVENKLNQILTKNGIGGNTPNPRFALVPKVIALSKNVTSTAPTMYVCNYQVTFYVGDVRTKTLFSSASLEFKGVGETETEAFKMGFQSIKNQDKSLLKMVEEGKKKIIDFYNTKCDAVITEAQTLSTQQKYAEAIAQLMLVPEDCKDCFEQARKAVEPIYQAKIDKECNELLGNMKAAMGKYNNDKALDYYTKIPKEANCFKESESLIQKHLANLKPEEKQKMDIELQKYKDEQSYKVMKLQAIQGVANQFISNFSLVEYAKANNSSGNWFW